jgi:hypothetical protein
MMKTASILTRTAVPHARTSARWGVRVTHAPRRSVTTAALAGATSTRDDYVTLCERLKVSLPRESAAPLRCTSWLDSQRAARRDQCRGPWTDWHMWWDCILPQEISTLNGTRVCGAGGRSCMEL